MYCVSINDDARWLGERFTSTTEAIRAVEAAYGHVAGARTRDAIVLYKREDDSQPFGSIRWLEDDAELEISLAGFEPKLPLLSCAVFESGRVFLINPRLTFSSAGRK